MPYNVFNYSKSELLGCIEKTTSSRSVLKSKYHLEYFDVYFNHIQVKTVVAERDYIDRDYLEDYSYYYVRNFQDYKRYCTRLHFFKNNFDISKFNNLLQGDTAELTEKILNDNYLGFMVIKPLPFTIIGKTCLISYSDKPERHYCTNRNYDVNLFGLQLCVSSLAYQEQDSVVAACASIALWSAFNGTGVLYHHTIPSPVEITKSATLYSSYRGRHFPMKDGLTPEQMAQSIRKVGLEPFCADGSKYEFLKCNIYAYLKAKIPAILGIYLYDPAREPRLYAGHAITITGFCLGDKVSKFIGNDLLLTSARINKIYTHDDAIGAYSSIEFNNMSINYCDKTNYNHIYEDSLPTRYLDINGIVGNVRAIPSILIFPLYHKIRIPYNAILFTIQNFNDIYNAVAPILGLPIKLDLEWDIFLCNIKDFKTEIFNNISLDKNDRLKILTTKLPKFIWRAKGINENQCKFEFLFDATDIEQGKTCLKYIQHEKSATTSFLESFAKNILLDTVENIQVKTIFEKIREA